jgi:hypothetical protein
MRIEMDLYDRCPDVKVRYYDHQPCVEIVIGDTLILALTEEQGRNLKKALVHLFPVSVSVGKDDYLPGIKYE